MKAVIIIPARLASTRLPGKVLADLGGKPIIQRVYERAQETRSVSQVFVATDDDQIAHVVRGFGGQAVMTRSDHRSGTERIAEAAASLEADIIVNLQGDEPEIDPVHLDRLITLQNDHGYFASTLACKYPIGISVDNHDAVKVVRGKHLEKDAWEALYFSRAAIPYQQGAKCADLFLHIGVYAFTPVSLKVFATAPTGKLEVAERLEQLRILEMGEKIAVAEVNSSVPGIDTPEDLAAARQRFLGAS